MKRTRVCALSDLDELLRHGEWGRLASAAQINSSSAQTGTCQRPQSQSPPAFTKEKGQDASSSLSLAEPERPSNFCARLHSWSLLL